VSSAIILYKAFLSSRPFLFLKAFSFTAFITYCALALAELLVLYSSCNKISRNVDNSILDKSPKAIELYSI